MEQHTFTATLKELEALRKEVKDEKTLKLLVGLEQSLHRLDGIARVPRRSIYNTIYGCKD